MHFEVSHCNKCSVISERGKARTKSRSLRNPYPRWLSWVVAPRSFPWCSCCLSISRRGSCSCITRMSWIHALCCTRNRRGLLTDLPFSTSLLHFLLEKSEGVVDTAVLEVSLGHGGHVASVRGLFVVKYGLFNKLVVVGVRGNLKESVAKVVTLDLCRVWSTCQSFKVFTEVHYLRPHLEWLKYEEEVLQCFIANQNLLLSRFRLKPNICTSHLRRLKTHRQLALVLSCVFLQTLDDIVVQSLSVF